MNEITEFQFNHYVINPCAYDARCKPDEELQPEHFYFLGFSAAVGEAVRYFHSWVLADDYDGLIRGISRLSDETLALLPDANAAKISLVFLHNMRTRQPDFMSSSQRQHVTAEIGDRLCAPNEEHFGMYGLAGNNDIRVADWQAVDALMALRIARIKCKQQFKTSFMPLGICQAHPVTWEFNILFGLECERIESFGTPAHSETIH